MHAHGPTICHNCLLAAATRPGSLRVCLQQAEDAMDGVLAVFLQTGVDPEMFASLKMQLRASNIYAKDDVEGLARMYGEALASGLTVQDVQDWPDVLDQVTPEDVMAAAHAVLDRKKAVTGWLMREDVPEVTQ